MYYNIYKHIRDKAWKCLVENGISSLPVNVLEIANANNIRVIRNSLVRDLLEDEDAKAYFDGESWIIIYNDGNDVTVSRYAIAHELGHILLEHALTYAKYESVKEIGRKPRAENHADMFAVRLLCPSCVLIELDIGSAQKLAEICRVPNACAEARYKRICELRERNKIYTNPYEITIREQFEEYIKSTGKETENAVV